MKTLPGKGKISGLTLIEVLAVIAIIAILAAILLPAGVHGGKARIPWCMSNLRQVDIGFLIYESDNHGKFPMQFSEMNGGTLESIQGGHVFPHLQKLAGYYNTQNMRILICPSDVERHAATNFETLTDSNISYFLNADVSTNSPTHSILAGDRNLEAVNQPLSPGLFVLTTNIYMRWADNLHIRRGCMTFADGHAELVRSNLNLVILSQPLATNRLCIP